MKILLTGATGYIGSAVGDALGRAGHDVHGLARSPRAEAALHERGITPVPGDLHDTERLRRAAASADGVIHAASTNDSDAAAVDTAATEAILDALEGTGRPFVYTSGVWVLGATGEESADEGSSTESPASLIAWRAGLERRVRAAVAHGVRATVLRPGIVYGRGGGIPALLLDGSIPLVGDGTQRWPMVHVDDLAELYVLALAAPAGSVLHGVAGTVRPIDLIGAARKEDVEPLTLEAARQSLGAFADALALDQRVEASRTRELVGWTPHRPFVLEEVAGDESSAA